MKRILFQSARVWRERLGLEGLAEHSTRINELIAEAVTRGEMRLDLPPGRFVIAGPLKAPTGFNVNGAGKHTKLIFIHPFEGGVPT